MRAVPRRRRAARTRSKRSRGWRGPTSGTPGCSSRSSSSARATSKCRSSATARRRRRARANATARCSAATRRCIEETPAPGLTRRRARRLREAAVAAGTSGRTTARRARSSSCSTRQRRLLLPRGEHAPAGGARRHRGGDRRRPGRVDGPRWRRATLPDLLGMPPRRRRRAHAIAGARSTPRTRRAASSRAAGCSPSVRFPTTCAWRPGSRRGTEVTPYYDPMLAKLIVPAPTRAEAIAQAAGGAGGDAHRRHRDEPRATCAQRARRRGASSRASTTTRPAGGVRLSRRGDRGAGARDADHRAGLSRARWATGTWAFRRRGPWTRWRFASQTALVGNDADAAGARVHAGRVRRCAFARTRVIALTGADMSADPGRRGGARASGRSRSRAGSRAAAGRDARGRAARAYLAVRGGIDVPRYLGSRSTFTLGGSAATAAARCARATCCTSARPRRRGRADADALPRRAARRSCTRRTGSRRAATARTARRTSSRPATSRCCSPRDWKVHYNSNRTGVRLIGPKPDVGAHRRRRGGPAPVEHSRQRLRRSAPSTSPATCR